MTVEDVLRQARVLADLGRYDDADPLLAQALAQEPDNEDGLSLLSRGLVVRMRFAEAKAASEQLLRAHPDSVRGLLAMARIEWLLGRPRDGVRFARRAVQLYPDDVSCLVTLADVLKKVTTGSAEALALIERAIAIDPENVTAHLVAGEINLDVGNYAEAEHWTLRALRIRPDDPQAILQLGLVRAGLGKFDESRDEVMAVLRMDSRPANIDQVIEHVECRAIPEHLAEVYRMMLAARGLPDLSLPGSAGDDAELVAAQGRLVYRMYSRDADPEGRRRAGELAVAVLAADPSDQNARYVMSRTLSDAERYDEALPLAEQLSAEGYPHADDALLVAQGGSEDYAAALGTVRRLLHDNPESEMYLRAEAQTLRHLERYDEALVSALRAAELSPSAAEVQLQLGLAAKAAGDVELAEQALRLAINQTPAEGEPVAELALLYTETDRWPQAEDLMATLRPDMPDVRRMLRPCAPLAQACLGRSLPALGAVNDQDPEPELLDEAAPWLDRALDMYAVAAQGYSQGTAAFSEMLVDILAALQKIAAPADSDYARVVRRLETLMDAWRSE